MNYLFSGILLSLALASCMGNNVVKKSRNLKFECTNDFQVSFSEDITFLNGDSTGKITVRVRSPRLDGEYQMEQAPAASGVKYVSKNGKYIFWEHQGEFSFGTEDSTYCLCN